MPFGARSGANSIFDIFFLRRMKKVSDGAKVAQKGANAARRKEKETKEAQNGARGKADAKRERKGIKIKPKATKMIHNCSQKATIGYQMGHKRLPKVDLGARVDFLCQKGGSQG